jgi:hypothetical protein
METTIQIQLSETLLFELESAGVKFAHWKSNIRLPESLEGKTDLDLLVHPDDRFKFERVLLDLSCKKLISQPWGRYPEVDDWLGMDTGTGSFLHIHAHYRIVTGIKHVKHLVLPWIEIFFRHIQKDPLTGWPIPVPEMETLVLLVRIWAKMPPLERLKSKPNVPGHILDELSLLLDKIDPDYLRNIIEEAARADGT